VLLEGLCAFVENTIVPKEVDQPNYGVRQHFEHTPNDESESTNVAQYSQN
jgi:hypothetical protein